jgi:pimeloyl-ACP methyl ester carboxylesterase
VRLKIDWVLPVALAAVVLAASAAIAGGKVMTDIERMTCPASDGVTIVYSASGSGEPALLFIHGGLAERSFWDAQLRAFSGRHRTLALDLPGHGDSGSDRTKWGLPEFGADVKAVIEAEKVNKVILIGNSLGGPVAIEAALLLPGKSVGVVGVDTFQRIDYTITQEEARQRAEAFRQDYSGNVKQMVRALFHPDADPALMADAERRMSRTPPEAAYAMFMSMSGYDLGAAARKLTVPLRAINGDLYPTDVPGVRRIKADFAAVILPHTGHYPMLECPEEFNRRLAEVVAGLLEPAS